MTIDDHRAAARERATVYRCVDEFENVIRFGRGVPDGLHANVKRIQRDLDRIRREMQEVQACTLSGDHEGDNCWRQIAATEAPAAVRRAITVLTIGQHITAARALSAAKLAILRFVEIVSDRKYLPVRILDFGLRVERLIHAVRCAMDENDD
jgi:hypothetical protein